MRHLPKVEYTKDDQKRDTSFLVGARYGRDMANAQWEAKIAQAIKNLPAQRTDQSHGALDVLRSLQDSENGQRLLSAWLDERLAPIVEVQQDWKKNFYSSFAKRLGRAIRKARL